MAEKPELLEMKREELEGFSVELIEKAEKKFDEKLDTKFDEFKESLVPEKEELIDPAEAMGKAIQYQYALKKNPTLLKTLDPQDITTAADGGTLVPTITRPEIVRLMEEYGQARSSFRQIPMGKANVLTLPGKLTGATIARVNEGSQIADTKVTLTTYTLTGSKVAAIVAFTNELMSDNIVDMGGYVNELLAEAFAQEEDEQMFAGTGSPHTGLFNASSTYGNQEFVANAEGITYDKLVNCAVGLKGWYLKGADWKMHRSVYGSIMKIKDDNGNPIVHNPGDPVRQSLFGYPIKLIETAPTSTNTTASMPLIILGNTNKNSFFGLKHEMSFFFLDQATVDSVNLAEYDMVGVRVTKRDAYSVGIVGGYSVIKINA